MVDIRPNALPDAILPLKNGDAIIIDQGADGVRQTSPLTITDSVAPVASQPESIAGIDNNKRMTSLRTKQSIASEVGVTLASNSQGAKADTAVQSVNGKTGNAVSLDKNDVGLGNVDNTSDASKPISTATQTALNGKATTAQGAKADSAVQSVNGKTGNSVSLVKGDVGLGNVDNTSDANKPVSTAQQTAIDAKANSSVTVSSGAGLTGGGNLTANRTISLNSSSIASLAKADSSVQTINGKTGNSVVLIASDINGAADKTSLSDQSFLGKITAPYILPAYRGLKISEFLTSNGGWDVVQRDQLQDAISALIAEQRYTELDLEGRNILVNSPVNFGTDQLGWPSKSISNGFIYATADFPTGSYIFDLKDNPSISSFKFTKVTINGHGRGGWVRAPKHYKYFTMESCALSNAGGSGGASPGILGRKVGLYDPDIPEGGSHELGFYGCYLDSNQYSGTKDQIAIYTRNPDVNINNCLGQYFKDFFVGTSGSYQLNGNHIWSPADGGAACSMVRLLDCTTIAGLQMTGNYVDGVQIVLSNELNPTGAISGASITGNLFLFGDGLPADMPFVLLKPQNANAGLMAIDMIGNTYDTNNTTNAFQNIGVDTTTGSINPAAIRRVRLDDVAYSEFLLGKVYRSRANYNTSFVSGDAGYKNISFDAQLPPFARIKRVMSAQYTRPDGTGPLVFAVPTIPSGGRGVDVVLSNGSTVQSASGRVEVVVDINVENYQ